MTERSYREALLEYTQNGGFLKVTAMDPDTLTEVSAVGPANGSRELLKRTALAKLDYVLRQKAEAELPPPSKPVMLNAHAYGPGGTLRRVK